MKTAFVVLTYNRPDTLWQTLRGLASQCGPQHEVLIADDGSSQASVDAVRGSLPSFRCPVYHVWHPDRGFTASRARNLGAHCSAADYLVFMDGDCVPNPRFVAGHAALQAKGYFVNGNRVLLSGTLTQQILSGDVDLQKARWADWLRWRLAGDANKLVHLLHWYDAPFRCESTFRWKKIRSCNFGVWREDFLAVNGFDESFQGWGHEDADLVLRLHNSGRQRRNGFCATEVYHLWHKENSRVNEERNRHMVVERMKTGLVRAVRGMDETILINDFKVTQFN